MKSSLCSFVVSMGLFGVYSAFGVGDVYTIKVKERPPMPSQQYSGGATGLASSLSASSPSAMSSSLSSVPVTGLAETDKDPQKIDHSKIFYITAMMNLGLLRLKADDGDMASVQAVHDFYASVKDSSYKIEYLPSKKLLEDLALLDCYGKVHQATREAFKIHDTK